MVPSEISCPNRMPVPGSHFVFDRPFQGKGRLTKREQEEVLRWEREVKGHYKCGHIEGLLIEFGPSVVLWLSGEVYRIFKEEPERFPLLRRLWDWRNYDDDELLAVPAQDAEKLEEEVRQLRRTVAGTESVDWHRGKAIRDLENQNKEQFWEAVDLVSRACEASRQSGNPIEFMW